MVHKNTQNRQKPTMARLNITSFLIFEDFTKGFIMYRIIDPHAQTSAQALIG
jgi:hypothetical protein